MDQVKFFKKLSSTNFTWAILEYFEQGYLNLKTVHVTFKIENSAYEFSKNYVSNLTLIQCYRDFI